MWGFGREGGKRRMGVSELGVCASGLSSTGGERVELLDLLEHGERLVEL